MKKIKNLDRGLSKNGKYWISFALFYCEYCQQEVVKQLSNGLKAILCGCIKNNKNALKHGGSYTRIYQIYYGIKKRCLNIKHKFYQYYGGRGIKVCPEWANSYIAFRDWALSNGYKDNLTIDRIDNDGDYTPLNCRWITKTEQQRNTRKIKLSLDKANKIRELNKSNNYTQQQIADMYNIIRQHVSDILNNKIWKNV